MDISKHAHLLGWYDLHCFEIENTPEAVAEFIINTAKEDVSAVISTPEHDTVITTNGMYVDRCYDQDFLKKLQPVLIPMQHKAENEVGLHCGCEAPGNQGPEIQM